VSAVPEEFMRARVDGRIAESMRTVRDDREDVDTPAQKFWLWFALATLVFCWIAEATLCAERGF
jgi:hypothetical protein